MVVKIYHGLIKYHEGSEDVVEDFFLSIQDAFVFQTKYKNSTMQLSPLEVEMDSPQYEKALKNIAPKEKIPECLLEPTDETPQLVVDGLIGVVENLEK